MADVVQMQKKIALLHRYPKDQIGETNAAFKYIKARGIDALTFKKFSRLSKWKKFFKSIAWIFYAPCLVAGRGYDVIYCDDSYPFYPILVKAVSPRSKVILRIGDFHLMYYTKGVLYNVLHFFERIGWIMADGIIAISEVMATHIEREIGNRPYVVLDPVDVDSFSGQKTYRDGTVMFHGVLTKNKNVDILLEAARRLPSVDFKIIGDGPDMKRLQSIAPSNVFFQGWVPFKDIPLHIASCSIGVALRSENIGNEYVVTSPYLQYGAMGKPCLVTRRMVYGDYEWQFSSAREMTDKIKILLDRPEEGEKLRQYIVENHDAKKIGDEIWKILLSA